MRAVILAGGKGTRLAPLTGVIPKALVPISGMPIMEIVIRQLKHHGIKRITLALGYMGELIQAYFQDGTKWGVKINSSYEEVPLGTAGPLSLIEDLVEPFLVMNADVLTNLDYRDLARFHQDHGGATIGSYCKEVQIDLGVVVLDKHYTIKDYIEKPKVTHQVSMGTYIFEPKVLSFIKYNEYLDFPDLIKMLISARLTVKAFPFNGYWLDIGRHDDYAKANDEFKSLRKTLLSQHKDSGLLKFEKLK